jgi:hypothetical protein
MKNVYVILIILVCGFIANPSFAQKRKKSKNKNKQTALKAKESTQENDDEDDDPFDLEKYLKNAEPLIEDKAVGVVNWSEQFVQAKGSAVIDTTRFKNYSQARAMAIRGAVVVAQRNLLETIKGVHVTSETTVENMIATNDLILTRVEGVIRGAEMVGEPEEKYGMMEVTMKVMLYHSKGLAPELHRSLPSVNQQSQSVQTNLNESSKSKGKDKPLVYNFNGKQIDPALFPVVVDENNNVIFDYSKYYDPKKGEFPKYLKIGRDVMSQVGFSKGVEVIDVISAQNGKIVISESSKSKVNWSKIMGTVGKIGKFLLMLI